MGSCFFLLFFAEVALVTGDGPVSVLVGVWFFLLFFAEVALVTGAGAAKSTPGIGPVSVSIVMGTCFFFLGLVLFIIFRRSCWSHFYCFS